ncbi:hypothetical protein RSOLAG22IIIB_06042 [Rhizoctonia solani]|uniref:BTB domain-containing protein n=1 Tax=Rhizoctonia solani TaxID=456999 RepID=A0A0K6GB93_9AGAM|nr:hypothetical protein RSOLAG22IIIB_06042 [Rhizoctonia solani]
MSQDITGTNNGSDIGSLAFGKDEEPSTGREPLRDSQYYFEDGSLNLRVEDTLFKVHTSLLKLRPSDLEGKFECGNSTGGVENVIIPTIKAAQFRNLMQVIYCPPSDKLFLSLPAIPSDGIEEKDALKQFIFYLDVTSLAHQFGMHDVEKWAKPRLQSLVHMFGRKISRGLDGVSNDDDLGFGPMTRAEADNSGGIAEHATYEEGSRAPEADENHMEVDDEDEESSKEDSVLEVSDEDEDEGEAKGKAKDDKNSKNSHESLSEEDSESDDDYSYSGQSSDGDDGSEEEDMKDLDAKKDDSTQMIKAEDSPIFRLIDGIWYAGEISDILLLHDIRNLLQYHCTSPNYLPVDLLLSFLRVPNLRERDPPTFGFLFLLLLDHGHKTWNRPMFTQTDRMAFFSAQSYLTPLPDSLKAPSTSPLFKKLGSAKKFVEKFSNNSTLDSAVQKCYREAFSCWRQEFDDTYYENLGSSEPLVAIKALGTIPRRRLSFSEGARSIECDHRCYLRLLGQIDRDIQGLYARLAEYYQPIN